MDGHNSNEALSYFHPLIARWFREKIGKPTDIQRKAWPEIIEGRHLLITAPTGSGKTLTAFLWALNQLITGKWPGGCTRVLYVSPLKALNNDIQRNLLNPLEDLRETFAAVALNFPEIRVLTRSGDTPPSDRRRMVLHPPEILITTPESLNLILSSPMSRSILTHLKTVILDEIHAVINTKRGAYLITAVDRLVRLSGEFQRIALSATVRPPEAAAEFIGGFTRKGEKEDADYRPRKVGIIASAAQKSYQLSVRYPEESTAVGIRDSFWDPFVREIKRTISRNRSTLIFVNSRRLCEFLALKINEDEKEPVAYAHHGSLALEIRSEVEKKLKAGELKAIVATHSLELGIDIGSLDEVILVQAPSSVSSAIQRIGRAGHRVGEMSRGTFFPTHAKDFLESAVLARQVKGQDLEELKPVRGPLDLLAQILVSMTGVETWDLGDLFAHLKTSFPYRDLSRRQFDLVLNMLAGRYAETRIRDLKPRVSIDRLDHTVKAQRGALQDLYLSGGVIPDRGYFNLRHQETNARIGDLDEEFVWEASVGDTFTLGAQSWQIRRITHNDVFVLPGSPGAAAAPFWKGEGNDRDFHFSERIGTFLEHANEALADPDFSAYLREEHFMEEGAAQKLVEFLKRQKEETGTNLPHRHHLLVEFVSSAPGGFPGNQIVIHTLWGGRVNRPFAMALQGAWRKRFGHSLEAYTSNDCVVLHLPHDAEGAEVLSLVKSGAVERLLRRRLEGTGFFGARFRECAGRALLLPRARFRERMPLWMSRLRSQKLLDAVMRYEDFPILLEAWRTCLEDEFDLKNLERMLNEVETGSITSSEVHTGHPSPFAQGDWWRQVNQFVYMDDQPGSGKVSRLRGTLLREVALTPGLRPRISRELAGRFEQKRQRLAPGYSPQTAREVTDWVKERWLIPEEEWNRLLEAVQRDHGLDRTALYSDLTDKLIRVQPREAEGTLIASREAWPFIARVFYGKEPGLKPETLEGFPYPDDFGEWNGVRGEGEEGTSVLGEWMRFYGPRSPISIGRTLGVKQEDLIPILDDLIDSEEVIQGELISGGDPEEVCDSENFEVLLRMARTEAIPAFEPLEIEWLPLFLADHQGVAEPQDRAEALEDRIEQLACYPEEAGTWEMEIFPARMPSYHPSRLDSLMQEGDLHWVGAEGHQIVFCFEDDLDLLHEEKPSAPAADSEEEYPETRLPPLFNPYAHLFPDPAGHYDFGTLLRTSQRLSPELAKDLWEGVWKGQVANDSFSPVRQAVLRQFKVSDLSAAESAPRRRRPMSRRTGTRKRGGYFFGGTWHLISRTEPLPDILEAEERKKDRVRLLLDRYGILFRELLQRELPAFHWSNLFRSLRIMELSGEVLSGFFFRGIPGPQFVSHAAFRRLQKKMPEDSTYWINATDPASLCGVHLDVLKDALPPRVTGTHLIYRGKEIVGMSRRNGKDLTFHVPPDDLNFPKYAGLFRHLLTRSVQPLRRIAIETINGEKAPQSPYVQAFRNSFEVIVDYRYLNLLRKPG